MSDSDKQPTRRFRAETDDGQEHEFHAQGYAEVFAELEGRGYPLARVRHADYWSVACQCWVSADDLLDALDEEHLRSLPKRLKFSPVVADPASYLPPPP